MEPHIAQAEHAKAEVVSLKEKLKALRAVDPKDKKIEAMADPISFRDLGVLEIQIETMKRQPAWKGWTTTTGHSVLPQWRAKRNAE
jgi:hypothetical protein